MIEPIESGPRLGLRALGGGGRLAVHSYDQIVRAVNVAFGPQHKALFAEPSLRGNLIDWFAPFESRDAPVRLIEASPERRQAGEAELARLFGDISAEAARLRRSAAESDRIVGETIGWALEIPSVERIWLLETQPVLTFWGHVVDRGHPVENPIATLLRAQPQPEPEPEQEPKRKTSVVVEAADADCQPRRRVVPAAWAGLAILLAILVVAGIYLLVLPHSRAPEEPTPSPQVAAVPPAAAPSTPPRPPTLPLDLAQVVRGCWKSGAGMKINGENIPIVEILCFQAAGSGRDIVFVPSKHQRCEGPLPWSRDGDQVKIAAHDIGCPSGKSGYINSLYICRNFSDSTALCTEMDAYRDEATYRHFDGPAP